MDVNEWFENGCDYQQGVELYRSLKGHSVNLVRLFSRKESKGNADKLSYELSKFRKLSKPLFLASENKEKSQKVKSVYTSATKSPVASPGPSPDPSPDQSKSSAFYRLNELHPDLHPISIKQRNDYQLAISAHSRLTRLHADEESAALDLCLEIEELFDGIETAQKVLDYYVTHKVVLDIKPRTYADLTPEQRVQARNNKRISVTKYGKKVESLKRHSKSKLSKSNKTKLEVSIERAEAKLLQHEMELQELNEIINGK